MSGSFEAQRLLLMCYLVSGNALMQGAVRSSPRAPAESRDGDSLGRAGQAVKEVSAIARSLPCLTPCAHRAKMN